MTRRRRSLPHPDCYRVSEAVWAALAPLVARYDPPCGGRQRMDARCALDGILYREVTGVAWNRLPTVFGDDWTIHRTRRRWLASGLLARLFAVIVASDRRRGAA